MNKMEKKLRGVLEETISYMSAIEADTIECALERLAAYEDTGLEPEEITALIAPPPNDPLTLAELREMDGEPVWVKIDGGHWGIVDVSDGVIALPGYCVIYLMAAGRLAYRRKPEEAECSPAPAKNAARAEHFKSRFERTE